MPSGKNCKRLTVYCCSILGGGWTYGAPSWFTGRLTRGLKPHAVACCCNINEASGFYSCYVPILHMDLADVWLK